MSAAGGLLLPWRGGAALALPDLGAAADLPVVAKPWPVSAELLEVRRLKALQQAYYAKNAGKNDPEHRQWRGLMTEYKAACAAVLARPTAAWGHAVEIAEIAWSIHPKAWDSGPSYDLLPKLEGIDGRRSLASGVRLNGDSDFFLRPVPALIEAVLTLGGGQRADTYIYGGDRG